MKMIEKLSIENNISNSKVISILVEEALSNRGIFSIKSTKEEIQDLDITVHNLNRGFSSGKVIISQTKRCIF